MTKEEIVNALTEAWVNVDEAAFRKYLHKDFDFVGPMMETHGLDAMLDAIKSCPFEDSCEKKDLIIQGDKAVNVFDWVVTAPFVATIPCVEVINFEGDQVRSSKLFFDTALLPQEVKEQMQQMAA